MISGHPQVWLPTLLSLSLSLYLSIYIYIYIYIYLPLPFNNDLLVMSNISSLFAKNVHKVFSIPCDCRLHYLSYFVMFLTNDDFLISCLVMFSSDNCKTWFLTPTRPPMFQWNFIFILTLKTVYSKHKIAYPKVS